MKILVANDDGINAPGIAALARSLAENPDNQVYVVAPDRERSATGHSLTLHKPLRVAGVSLDGKIVDAWSTTGTPSDCVKLAISVLMPDGPPDLVVSGINNGSNMGSEILYSGTVAAAMEGTFMNVPSIAVSLVREGREENYEMAAEFMRHFVDIYSRVKLPSTLININIPSISARELAGVVLTELGVRQYNDWFEHRRDPRGNDYYWLAGHVVKEGEKEGSDADAVNNNKISITPVTFRMTDFKAMDQLRGLADLNPFVSGGK